MREIKFRAKVKQNGLPAEWVYGGLIHITETYKGDEDVQECNIYQIIDEQGVGFTVDEDTIGQYTGLKDKTGKEIYEGDVLLDEYSAENKKTHSVKECYKVEYGEWNCGCCGHIYGYKIGDMGGRYYEKTTVEGYIVGNICDDPKLKGAR